jgi:hypothetical protein
MYTLHTVCTSIDLWARAMNINISLIQNVPPSPLTKKHCSFRERHRSMMSSPLYREFLAISNSVSTGRQYLRVPTVRHENIKYLPRNGSTDILAVCLTNIYLHCNISLPFFTIFYGS